MMQTLLLQKSLTIPTKEFLLWERGSALTCCVAFHIDSSPLTFFTVKLGSVLVSV